MDDEQVIEYLKLKTRAELWVFWNRVLNAIATGHPLQVGDIVTVDCDALLSDPMYKTLYPRIFIDNWLKNKRHRIERILPDGLCSIDYNDGSLVQLPRIFLIYQVTPGG